MAAKTANSSRAFWSGVNKTDSFYKNFLLELCRAYHRGYSVVELTRIMAQSSCRRIYDTLRDEGAIPKLRRGRRQQYEIPPLLQQTLGKADISFAQWANSHNLDPENAAYALEAPVDTYDPVSVATHSALKNDWPRMHDRIYDLENTPFLNFSLPKKPGRENKDRVVISRDRESRRFIAQTEGYLHCRGEGYSPEVALQDLKRRYVWIVACAKLRLLPPHPGPAFVGMWEEI